jgi:hypothetical protein
MMNLHHEIFFAASGKPFSSGVWKEVAMTAMQLDPQALMRWAPALMKMVATYKENGFYSSSLFLLIWLQGDDEALSFLLDAVEHAQYLGAQAPALLAIAFTNYASDTYPQLRNRYRSGDPEVRQLVEQLKMIAPEHMSRALQFLHF